MFRSLLIAGVLLMGLLMVSCGNQQESSFLFEELNPKRTGIQFLNKINENALTNSFVYEYVYNGAGVAIGDVNNDGLEDLYFTSNLSNNALYLNQGNLKFKEISSPSGTIGKKGWTTGANMIDINNDGWLDIYICKSGPYERKELLQNELYINQGLNNQGIPTFQEAAAVYGLDASSYSMQSAFLDFDLDGDLDMYLMNHNPQTFGLGDTETISPLGDKFYENINGKYVDKTKAVGIYSNAVSYGLGVGVGDLNNDGWPDIYISNDYDEPDYMYINQKDGTFKEVVKQATNHISNFAMGNDVADFDNDGFLDIISLDMVAEDNYGMKTSMASMNPEKFQRNLDAGKHYQYMYNTLQKNSTHFDADGMPFFSDVGQIAGISNTDWSWAPLLADFDNDGLKDIFITNGIKRDFRNKDFYNEMKAFMESNPDALSNPTKINSLIEKTPHRPYKNYFYKNTGGLKFDNMSSEWIEKAQAGYSNGAAYADLDNDGDLDIVINNVDAKATILKNNANQTNANFLSVSFNGPAQNINGIGTRLKVYTNNSFQVFENYSVRGYLSSVPAKLHIGLGQSSTVDSIVVHWPNGGIEKIITPTINAPLSIDYKNAKAKKPAGAVLKSKETIFERAAKSFNIKHIENQFDDYQHQILLPHKMSQFGPAIAVGDVNGDGREDLYLGQATGTPAVIYTQTAGGEFDELQTFAEDAIYEDIDASFFDFDLDGDLDLFVVSGGNEFQPGSPNYQDRLYENRNGQFVKRSDVLPEVNISGSNVAIADFDGDGDDDILVGGRHIPHDYPQPASSYLLKNEKGQFVNITESNAPELENIGLVTDLKWTDFDQDGDLDFCVVGEWMAPTFFENTNNSFKSIESPMLEALSGWYYSIEAIDIDNDGDNDFVLGNLGENYKYKASDAEPFEIYYKDFDENGQSDLVLGYYNSGDLYPVRGRECSSQQMPSIKKITPNYDVFGKSTLGEIYGEENLEESLHLMAYNFKSGILINQGSGKFSFKEFPDLAQISSINSTLFIDIDQDGLKDLVMAGNLFTSEIETPRNDAGYGIILKNNGEANFTAVNAHQSGLFLPKDIKKLRMIKINGKTHLIGASNNDELSIFILTDPNIL